MSFPARGPAGEDKRRKHVPVRRVPGMQRADPPDGADPASVSRKHWRYNPTNGGWDLVEGGRVLATVVIREWGGYSDALQERVERLYGLRLPDEAYW